MSACVCIIVSSSIFKNYFLLMYLTIYPKLLCFAFSMQKFSFCLCQSFVVDVVLAVAVFGLCENLLLIVSFDSCTTTGVFE